ncbi:MAG TPA: hypothetical protein VHO70_15280 [Chitinispirillaceae bacterium]|nr:hypothetical protein [Chitinispirillaceae bacterium]
MKLLYVLLFAGLLSSGLLAQDSTADSIKRVPKVALSGYGYYMFGQLISGIYGDEWETPTTILEHLWTNTFLLHLSLVINAPDWLTLKFGGEFYMQHTQAGKTDKRVFFRKIRTDISPEIEVSVHHAFNFPIFTSLRMRTGIFPYMFNPEVKTLGNYLFRSTVHPLSVQNKVDYPWAKIIGSVGEVGLFEDRVRLETIVTKENSYVPFYDYTPAFALYFKTRNEIIDIGGAVAFQYALQSKYTRMEDSLHKKWQGTKLDFRAVFDPKPIFGGMDFLGKDQLRIYTELAFLGLKDSLEVDTSNLANLRTLDPDSAALKGLMFPANSILHRMPFMIGINFPTLKIVDLLSLELEWFYSPYANDWFGLFDAEKPIARQPCCLKQWDNYINKDNFSWSLHTTKSIGKFEVRGIFGRDHTIYTLSNLHVGNFEQTMKRPKDWHWNIQLRYNL